MLFLDKVSNIIELDFAFITALKGLLGIKQHKKSLKFSSLKLKKYSKSFRRK